jgi:hypothetical protein
VKEPVLTANVIDVAALAVVAKDDEITLLAQLAVPKIDPVNDPVNEPEYAPNPVILPPATISTASANNARLAVSAYEAERTFPAT